jgi:hypothetical protein
VTAFSWVAVASWLEVQVGHAFGVSTHLYRFSRSRRVLLYKSIGRNDRKYALSLLAPLADWDTSPHYSRGFVTKAPRRQARRGVDPPGSFEGGAPPSWGFYRGAGPPCRSGRGRLQSRACDGREAHLTQYVDRPSGEPVRRQACRSDVSAVAVEAFVSDAG